ncbi:hypothetical protein B0H13DRAFT_2300505 [Mycena leptocephala]|nr:hypothetical protein B0H13DRAFT_2300505 [Mycena leptocephala]
MKPGPAQTPAQTPKRSRRACRAPTAPDKTPPPPPPPAQTKTRRQRQPAPPAEPVPAPPVDPAPIPAGPEGPPVEPDRVGDSNGHAATRPHDIFDDDNPSVFRLRHTFHGLPYRQDKPPGFSSFARPFASTHPTPLPGNNLSGAFVESTFEHLPRASRSSPSMAIQYLCSPLAIHQPFLFFLAPPLPRSTPLSRSFGEPIAPPLVWGGALREAQCTSPDALCTNHQLAGPRAQSPTATRCLGRSEPGLPVWSVPRVPSLCAPSGPVAALQALPPHLVSLY